MFGELQWTPEFITALSTFVVAVLAALGALFFKLKPSLESWWAHRREMKKIQDQEKRLQRIQDLEEREKLLTLQMMEKESTGPEEALKYVIRKAERENRKLSTEINQIREHYERELSLLRGNYFNTIQELAKVKSDRDHCLTEIESLKRRLGDYNSNERNNR